MIRCLLYSITSYDWDWNMTGLYLGRGTPLTSPPWMSYSLRSSCTAVVLPQPLGPTRATVWPKPTFRLNSLSTCMSGRVGYEKPTFLNSTSLWNVASSGTVPASELESIGGC